MTDPLGFWLALVLAFLSGLSIGIVIGCAVFSDPDEES